MTLKQKNCKKGNDALRLFNKTSRTFEKMKWINIYLKFLNRSEEKTSAGAGSSKKAHFVRRKDQTKGSAIPNLYEDVSQPLRRNLGAEINRQSSSVVARISQMVPLPQRAQTLRDTTQNARFESDTNLQRISHESGLLAGGISRSSMASSGIVHDDDEGNRRNGMLYPVNIVYLQGRPQGGGGAPTHET